MRFLVPLCVFVLAAACAPDREGPVDAVVLGLEAGEGFALRERELSTIDSVGQVRGDVTNLLKEARLRVDPEAEEELLAIDFVGGRPVRVLFSEQDGLVVPSDYDSLVLLSYYSHVEDSADFFRDLGVDVDDPGFTPVTTHVAPELDFLSNITLVDNAAYLPTEHVFFVLPAFFFEENVPLGANDGVVTHEFSHAVFHYILNGNDRLPREYADEWPEKSIRYLRALNEGLADVFAVARTKEPDFIALSIPAISDARDASVRRDYTVAMRNALQSGSDFTPYDLGAVIASAAWRIAEDSAAGLGHEGTAQLAMSALRDLRDSGAYATGDLTISVYLNLFVEAARPGSERTAVCNVLEDQFSIIAGELTSCP